MAPTPEFQGIKNDTPCHKQEDLPPAVDPSLMFESPVPLLGPRLFDVSGHAPAFLMIVTDP